MLHKGDGPFLAIYKALIIDDLGYVQKDCEAIEKQIIQNVEASLAELSERRIRRHRGRIDHSIDDGLTIARKCFRIV